MDRLVLGAARVEERVESERVASESESREVVRSVFVFTGLAAIYSVLGEPQHTSLFFAGTGALAWLGKAWYSWRHEAERRSRAPKVGITVAATIVGIAAFTGLIATTMPAIMRGPRGFGLVTPAAIFLALVYRRSGKSDAPPEYSLFVSGGLIIAVAIIAAIMHWGGG